MKLYSLEIPDKIFGIESSLAVMFTPVVVLVVLMIVGTNLIVVPQLDEYGLQRLKLRAMEDQTTKLVEKTKYLQSVDPAELKKNSDFISSALLPQRNAYLLVGVVRKIADIYGFQVDSFVINPGKMTDISMKVTEVQKIPIKLSLVGSTARYLELIKGLEKSLPVLSLESLDMKNNQDVAKIDLQISAYYVEGKDKYDISKITLSDLTLKKEESDLISILNEFTILEKNGSIVPIGKGNFQRYERPDPFNP